MVRYARGVSTLHERHIVGAAAVLAFLAIASACSAPTRDCSPSASVSLPASPVQLPWIEARSSAVQGRLGDRDLTLLLDTGFPQSALSLQAAQGHDLQRVEFDLAGVRVGPLEAKLLLAPLGVDGVLGAELLSQLPLRLDARARVTEVLPAFSAPGVHGRESTLVAVGALEACDPERPAAMLIEATVEGSPATFVLDTGAELTFVRSTLFEPLTHDRAVLRDIRVGSGFAGAFVATATRARTLSIGEHTSRAALLLSAPAVDKELDRLGTAYGRQVDGFLGWSFLREFEVSLATPAALGLQRFDTQSHWTREFVGIGIHRAPSENPPGIRVEGFLDPSPAKLAGVQLGDVIVKVDGTPVSGAELIQAHGERIELELIRDAQSLTLQVEYRDLLPDPAP